jgi:hypothetical protein
LEFVELEVGIEVEIDGELGPVMVIVEVKLEMQYPMSISCPSACSVVTTDAK